MLRWFVVCVLVIASPSTAAADDDLRRAREEFASIELENAERSLEAALVAGGRSHAELVEIYLLQGQIAAALGRTEEAVDRFERALSLDADADLTGVAPKIAMPFERARTRSRSRRPFAVEHRVELGRERAIVLRVVSDPLHLAAGARLLDVSTGEMIRAAGGRTVRLVVPGADRREVIANVLDRHGNLLAEIGTRAVPIAIPASSVRAQPPSSGSTGKSVLTRWYLWLGVGALAAGTGTYFAVAARNAESDLDELNRDSANHSFDEAQAVEDRWRRDALIANIGFGAGAALGTVAVVCLIRDLVSSPGSDDAGIDIAPTGGGAAARIWFRF